jgi:hypothetical protein
MLRRELLAAKHQQASSRCTVCRSSYSMYGCTSLICRGLDCD